MLNTGRLPYDAVRELTRNRSTPYTVYRPDGTVEGWGEQQDAFSTRTVDIDFTSNTSAREQKDAGTEQNLTVSGRALGGADIEEGDLIEYRSTPMEVESLTPHPTGANTQFVLIGLRERTDISTGDLS
jgi:hypothetical protein